MPGCLVIFNIFIAIFTIKYSNYFDITSMSRRYYVLVIFIISFFSVYELKKI